MTAAQTLEFIFPSGAKVRGCLHWFWDVGQESPFGLRRPEHHSAPPCSSAGKEGGGWRGVREDEEVQCPIWSAGRSLHLIGQEPPLLRLSLKRRPGQLAKSTVESSPWWGNTGCLSGQERWLWTEAWWLGPRLTAKIWNRAGDNAKKNHHLEASGDNAGLGVSQQRGKFRATKAWKPQATEQGHRAHRGF